MREHALLNQTIVAIHLADDQGAIKFTLADGREVIARCDGDCCSHTWIEDVIDPVVAIGAPVTKAEDIDLPADMHQPTKTEHYEEEMAYYGFAIETSQGRFTIAYRNSSNGYYGGSLSWDADNYYGGVHGQNMSKDVWRLVAGAQSADAVDPHVGVTTE